MSGLRFWICLGAIGFLAGCESVPGGGRSQLLLVDDEDLAAEASAAFAKFPRARDEATTARLKTVAHKIIRAARSCPTYGAPFLPPPERWEIVLIDDATANAFAMPGGKIGIHRGILPFFPTDADLATVISHEVAHVACRHGAERVSHSLLAMLGAVAVDQVAARNSPEHRQEILAAFGAAATLGVILPYSRKHEYEADRVGLVYMTRAGYDPKAAVDFWRRFSASKAGGPPEFLSTHPSDTQRVKELEASMSEARRLATIPAQPAQRVVTPTGANR